MHYIKSAIINTREIWCFFYLRLNQQLGRQWVRRWFETPSRPLWCHCNERYWLIRHAISSQLQKQLSCTCYNIHQNWSLWCSHNDHDSVSNHQPHECLLNRLFRRRSKKISKLRVTGLCVGNSPGPVNSPHRGPVTRKMFPFDDVIMVHIGTNASVASFGRCDKTSQFPHAFWGIFLSSEPFIKFGYHILSHFTCLQLSWIDITANA